jgi:SAM-dependent methyltransferase
MTNPRPYYQELAEHYEKCLEKHGTVPKGVDWPNLDDLNNRFSVMLALCKRASPQPIKLLDLGCGYGAFLDYLKSVGIADQVEYVGMDISAKMIDSAKKLHMPHHFEQRDILLHPLEAASYDYVVMNGLFTEKQGLSQAQMELFFKDMVTAAFAACRQGIAFNVMSFHVDWFRDDLFHLSLDRMTTLIHECCSRNLIIRSDYGLYEYTVYAYKQPNVG